MKLEELLSIISQKTASYVNQSMLADALGITRQTVSNRIKNDSQVTVSELQKIEEFFNISLLGNNSMDNDIVYIDYYTDVFASCGNGNIVFSNEKIRVPVSKILINGYSSNKTYSMIEALLYRNPDTGLCLYLRGDILQEKILQE